MTRPTPSIRAATIDDWPAIWRFMRVIAAAGETFSWDRDIPEADARESWLHEPPGGALVAVGGDGAILGSATWGRNHGGGASHIARIMYRAL